MPESRKPPLFIQLKIEMHEIREIHTMRIKSKG